jgi:hypothetical protein
MTAETDRITVCCAQLTELNIRARTYTTQMWTVPLTYLGVVAVFLAGENVKVSLTARLLVSSALGLFVMWHLVGVEDGRDRAVRALQAIERELGLSPTAKSRRWLMWPLPTATGFFAGGMFGTAVSPVLSYDQTMSTPSDTVGTGCPVGVDSFHLTGITQWPTHVLVTIGLLTLLSAIYWWWDQHYGTDTANKVEKRITELNLKASQILLFLSFAMVAAVTLRATTTLGCNQRLAVTWALRWWTGAIFPVILCVLPIKDISRQKDLWYRRIRRAKIVLLGIAIGAILAGSWQFFWAI